MLLDVSMPVTERTAPWPGDRPFACGWSARIGEADAQANTGWVETSPHVGTHVDAPYHVDPRGHRVGGFRLDAFVGRCHVVDARGRDTLDADLLRGLDLARAPRVLFRTQERRDPETFLDRFPTLTDAAADALVRGGVLLVGVDAPSFDAVEARELRIHQHLAAAHVAGVENLILDEASEGEYELLAQPVAWPDMDAAPLRAILRR